MSDFAARYAAAALASTFGRTARRAARRAGRKLHRQSSAGSESEMVYGVYIHPHTRRKNRRHGRQKAR